MEQTNRFAERTVIMKGSRSIGGEISENGHFVNRKVHRRID
jgi:hypothetical protein